LTLLNYVPSGYDYDAIVQTCRVPDCDGLGPGPIPRLRFTTVDTFTVRFVTLRFTDTVTLLNRLHGYGYDTDDEFTFDVDLLIYDSPLPDLFTTIYVVIAIYTLMPVAGYVAVIHLFGEFVTVRYTLRSTAANLTPFDLTLHAIHHHYAQVAIAGLSWMLPSATLF